MRNATNDRPRIVDTPVMNPAGQVKPIDVETAPITANGKPNPIKLSGTWMKNRILFVLSVNQSRKLKDVPFDEPEPCVKFPTRYVEFVGCVLLKINGFSTSVNPSDVTPRPIMVNPTLMQM